MADTLKPCPNPWCTAQSPPLLCALKYEGWRVVCECGVSSWRKPTEAEAITAWNTRTIDDAPDARDDLGKVLKRLGETLADADAMDMSDDALLSWDADETPNLTIGDLRTLHAAALSSQPSQDVEAMRDLLGKLHALVWSECPSLLNEDSGGDAALDVDIRAALSPKEPG